MTAKGTERHRVRRTSNRKRTRYLPRSPRVLGLIVFLILVVVTGIAARSLGEGASPTVPTTAPFRYTIQAGDTVASVSSLFAADVVDVASQTGGAPAPGRYLTVDAARLWKRMSSDPFGSNQRLVERGARQVGVQPSLALAVAWQESRLQQEARSPTGAVGIMQVEPDTSSLAARDLGRPIDPTRATDNVTAGLFWLHTLLNTYHQDEASALAAYYEGPGNLQRRGYLSGTAEYVAHVQQLQRALLTANPQLDA